MLRMLRGAMGLLLHKTGYRLERIPVDYPVLGLLSTLDPAGVEILESAEFQASCREIRGFTVLDTIRLANLWQLCQMTNPLGNIIEVGTYRGGGGLHLSNSCPTRKIFVSDSFAGFESIDSELDGNFSMQMFKDTAENSVKRLFKDKNCGVQIIKGFFPSSCEGIDISPISFAHVDVDIYKATIETLLFLDNFMIEKSLIVLDDYNRKAAGVNKAIDEFVKLKQGWATFPMFPSQAVLIHKSWFE